MRIALLCAWLLLAAVAAHAQPQPPKDFVPVDETLPGEQVPALPLIAGCWSGPKIEPPCAHSQAVMLHSRE